MPGARLQVITLYINFVRRSYYAIYSTVCIFCGLSPALLMPPDHTRKECLAGLRQPGLQLLSSHFADPPEPEDEAAETRCLREEFGGAYKELRGRGRSRIRRLSTGVARVKAKTDCWLTFEEFQKLTE